MRILSKDLFVRHCSLYFTSYYGEFGRRFNANSHFAVLHSQNGDCELFTNGDPFTRFKPLPVLWQAR